MNETPVSWLVIEPGWKVVAADGSELGVVHEVVGDSGKDIFDGLTVSSGLFARPRYVASERVRRIVAGRVEVDVGPAEAERLPHYEEPPPSEEIEPVTASWWQRLAGRFRR